MNYPKFPYLPQASCATADPEAFFLDGAPTLESRLAQKICSTCPEQVPCLQWALDTNEEYGIWGGVQPRDRRNMRTALKRASA